MKSIAIRYGVGAFIVTVIWTMIEHVSGFNTTNHAVGQYTRGVPTLIFVAIVALAIWKLKQLQDGALRFADGIRVGGLVSGIYSLLVCCWFALYAEVINRQYKSSLLAFQKKKLEATFLSEENLQAKMEQIERVSGGNVTSYVMLVLYMMVFGLVASVLASMMMSRVVRRGM